MNKLKFILFAIALTLFLFTADESKAQTKQPVRFAKGATSAEVRGKIINGKPASYLVSVKAGQTISVKVINSKGNEDVFFEIITPDGNRIGGNERDMDAAVSRKIRKGGDYLIWISGTENQSAAYKLQISIR